MNRNGMRYMWKFFLLLVLVVTSCSEKQIDGNVINVAEAMSRLSEGQSVQNLFSSISYIPLYGAQNETYIECWEKKTSNLLIYKRLCKI